MVASHKEKENYVEFKHDTCNSLNNIIGNNMRQILAPENEKIKTNKQGITLECLRRVKVYNGYETGDIVNTHHNKLKDARTHSLV